MTLDNDGNAIHLEKDEIRAKYTPIPLCIQKKCNE